MTTATWTSMLSAYPVLNTTRAFPVGTPFPSGYFPTASRPLFGNEETEMVDAMALAYGGSYPANRAPQIAAPGVVVTASPGAFPVMPGFTAATMPKSLNGSQSAWLQIGQQYTAQVIAQDPDGNSLFYMWQIIPRAVISDVPYDPPPLPASSGGIILTQDDSRGVAVFQPPITAGTYRLQVWVSDGQGKVATASFPFNATTTKPPLTLPVYGDTFITDDALIASGPSAGAYGLNAYSVRRSQHPLHAALRFACEFLLLAVRFPCSQSSPVNVRRPFPPPQTNGGAATMTLSSSATNGGNNIGYLEFAMPQVQGGSSPSSCTLSFFCISGPPSFLVQAYGVSNVLQAPWNEGTLSWFSANVSGTYPFGVGAGYRTLAGETVVTTCRNNWVTVDMSLLCLWAGDNAAAFVSAALVTSAPASQPVTIATKEFVSSSPLGAVLYMSEPQVASSGALAMSVNGGGPAPPPPASGRRHLQAIFGQSASPPPPPLFQVAVIPVPELQTAVAAAVPGLNPLAVVAEVDSYAVRSTLVVSVPRLDVISRAKLTNLTRWNTTVQNDFTAALALDGGFPGSFVSINSITVVTTGVAIPFSINGYTGGSDAGLTAATLGATFLEQQLLAATCNVTNSLSADLNISASLINLILLNPPTIFAQMGVGITVDASSAPQTQAAFNNAIQSGLITQILNSLGVNAQVEGVDSHGDASTCTLLSAIETIFQEDKNWIEDPKNRWGIVAGAAALVLLAGLLALCICCCVKKREKEKETARKIIEELTQAKEAAEAAKARRYLAAWFSPSVSSHSWL